MPPRPPNLPPPLPFGSREACHPPLDWRPRHGHLPNVTAAVAAPLRATLLSGGPAECRHLPRRQPRRAATFPFLQQPGEDPPPPLPYQPPSTVAPPAAPPGTPIRSGGAAAVVAAAATAPSPPHLRPYLLEGVFKGGGNGDSGSGGGYAGVRGLDSTAGGGAPPWGKLSWLLDEPAGVMARGLGRRLGSSAALNALNPPPPAPAAAMGDKCGSWRESHLMQCVPSVRVDVAKENAPRIGLLTRRIRAPFSLW